MTKNIPFDDSEEATATDKPVCDKPTVCKPPEDNIDFIFAHLFPYFVGDQ